MLPAEAGGCAALAAAAGEPLAGTASRIRHWLLLEQPGPWGHEALLDSDLPRDVGAALLDTERALGIRVLLIKRRDRRAGAPRRCYAAFTGRRQRVLATFEVEHPGELLEIDLETRLRTRWAGFGDLVPEPLVVVCTHGKHDPCCAREGAPVARALADRPNVWEATHVGGDRFAGNLVCFPHGIYYGRVTPDAAPALVDAYAEGRLLLEHYRGRSSHAPAVQAAEAHLRRELGLDGVDDLWVVEHERDGLHRVAFELASGEVRRVEVEEAPGEQRYLTCKATHPHRPPGFAVHA